MWPCEHIVCSPPTAVKVPGKGEAWCFMSFLANSSCGCCLRGLSRWWPWGREGHETEEACRLWAKGGMKSGGFLKFENRENCVNRNWYQFWSLFYMVQSRSVVVWNRNGRREGHSACKVTLLSSLQSLSNLPLPVIKTFVIAFRTHPGSPA